MATASALRNKQADAALKSAEGAYKRGRAAERQARVAEKKMIPDIIGSAAKSSSDVVKGVGSLIAAVNDPSWYKKLGITDVTARLPEIPGPGSAVTDYFLDSNNDTTLPSVHVSYWIPTIGIAKGNPSDPANYASANFMAQLRKFNSRAGTEYDPGDLMQLQIFTAYVSSVLEDIRFCIGAYLKFSSTHKNIAKLLITAKGYDFATFESGRANIITKFNECVNRLNYLPMVKDMPLRQRWEFLSKLCIRDARTSKGSFYMFAAHLVPRYNPEEGTIKFFAHGKNPITTLTNLLQYICEVTDSASMLTMLSDMRGGMDESALYQLPYVFEDYVIEFQESREVIDQIHNMTSYPSPDFVQQVVPASGAATPTPNITINTSNFNWLSGLGIWDITRYNNIDIYQNSDGYLIQGGITDGIAGLHFFYSYDGVNGGPKGDITYVHASHVKQTMLDFDSDSVTTDSVIVGSRLTTLWDLKSLTHKWDGKTTNTTQAWVPTHYGSEIVLFNLIFQASPSSTDVVGYVAPMVTCVNSGLGDNDETTKARRKSLTARSTFHWAPKYYLGTYENGNYHALIWDMGNLMSYVPNIAENLNYMCVLSECSFEEKSFRKIR